MQNHVNGQTANVLIKNAVIALLKNQINNNASIGFNIVSVMDNNVLSNYKIVISIIILMDAMDW